MHVSNQSIFKSFELLPRASSCVDVFSGWCRLFFQGHWLLCRLSAKQMAANSGRIMRLFVLSICYALSQPKPPEQPKPLIATSAPGPTSIPTPSAPTLTILSRSSSSPLLLICVRLLFVHQKPGNRRTQLSTEVNHQPLVFISKSNFATSLGFLLFISRPKLRSWLEPSVAISSPPFPQSPLPPCRPYTQRSSSQVFVSLPCACTNRAHHPF